MDLSTQTGQRDSQAAHSPMPCLPINSAHKRNHEHAKVHQGQPERFERQTLFQVSKSRLS